MEKSAPQFSIIHNRRHFYYAAIESGLWENIRTALVKRVWTDTGRNANPRYAIIDSQSVKTTSAAEKRRIDGEKNKRKQTTHHSRHHGLSSGGSRPAANIYDTKSGILAARTPLRNTRPLSASVPMQDIEKTLSRMFLKSWVLALTFQYVGNLHGNFYLNDGLLSVLLPESATPAIFPKIIKYLFVLLRLSA